MQAPMTAVLVGSTRLVKTKGVASATAQDVHALAVAAHGVTAAKKSWVADTGQVAGGAGGGGGGTPQPVSAWRLARGTPAVYAAPPCSVAHSKKMAWSAVAKSAPRASRQPEHTSAGFEQALTAVLQSTTVTGHVAPAAAAESIRRRARRARARGGMVSGAEGRRRGGDAKKVCEN